MKQKLGMLLSWKSCNGQKEKLKIMFSSFKFILKKEDDLKNAAQLVIVRGEDGTRPKLSRRFHKDVRMYVGSTETQLKERFTVLSEEKIHKNDIMP